MAKTGKIKSIDDFREWVSGGFTRVEDFVYFGLALLLAGGAVVLLVSAAVTFAESVVSHELGDRIVELLDRILLILMIVEILSTVQVSLKEHTLKPEPFLIVGLIAAIRRILILTAEFSSPEDMLGPAFQNAMFELGLLTLLILSLGVALFLLRRRPGASIERD